MGDGDPTTGKNASVLTTIPTALMIVVIYLEHHKTFDYCDCWSLLHNLGGWARWIFVMHSVCESTIIIKCVRAVQL